MSKEREFLSGLLNIVTFSGMRAYQGVPANDFFNRYFSPEGANKEVRDINYNSLQNEFTNSYLKAFGKDGYPYRDEQGALHQTKEIKDLMKAVGIDEAAVEKFSAKPEVFIGSVRIDKEVAKSFQL